ncbi:MAG: sigma-70 family RNA polymerase sigma factor [Lachnospiraceae bacterium]|nr:sigma-70 family RNA polymerase sigma factor [Lachnospiraceae bacterium]
MRVTLQELVEKYKQNIYVASFGILKNKEDAEDVVQDTFYQYYVSKKEFDSEEHIKAWLLRVAINKSKNTVTSFWKKKNVSIEDFIETLTFDTPESKDLFETVISLPDKYKVVIHLFYYEDYSVKEIAKILGISESNVKVRLNRGRSILKEKLKEEWEDDE